MANMLDSGAAWLLQRLQQSSGRTATYIRGGKRIAITAVRVAQDESVLDANGIPIRVVDHELTVDAAALPWEPQAGDIITETVNGSTVRWEVVPRGDSGAWEWWDDARQAYRVFVQEV